MDISNSFSIDKVRTAGYTPMDDDMDSDERGSGKSEEESDEKREQLITIHEESDEREEVRGWEEEVYGATQWEERELQAHMD